MSAGGGAGGALRRRRLARRAWARRASRRAASEEAGLGGGVFTPSRCGFPLPRSRRPTRRPAFFPFPSVTALAIAAALSFAAVAQW